MSQNNAHLGETREHRLRRFRENPPIEVIDTIVGSINNFFNNEIQSTLDNPANRQTSLMLLGTHAVALTIGYGLFGLTGEKSYEKYLQNFVDGDTPDTKFSTISSEIHEWRNVIAHRWLNVAGHNFGYDFDMQEGWRRDGETTMLNPRIYLEHYLRAFGPNGKIYRYKEILTTDDMLEEAKARFISKYEGEA